MKLQWLGAATVLVAAPGAQAVQYFSIEQAQQVLFAQATEFRARPTLLTDAQRSRVAEMSDTRVRSAQLQLWEARDAQGLLGYVMRDEVYGKHEFITYAVALSPAGKVMGIEILDYRETYGGQIRGAAWREQFVGKGKGDTLKLDQDIKNISGATLSCSHITEGVRRLLASFDVAVRPVGS